MMNVACWVPEPAGHDHLLLSSLQFQLCSNWPRRVQVNHSHLIADLLLHAIICCILEEINGNTFSSTSPMTQILSRVPRPALWMIWKGLIGKCDPVFLFMTICYLILHSLTCSLLAARDTRSMKEVPVTWTFHRVRRQPSDNAEFTVYLL